MEINSPAQQHEYRIIGLSRSGNHAIINWIIRQIKGRYLFLNCTEPKFNPFLTSRPLNDSGNTYETNLPNFFLKQEQSGIFSEKDYLLYNHEDCFLGSMNKKENRDSRENWVGKSEVQKDILLLRDPFNLMASRIKAGLVRGHYTHHGAKPISLLTLKRLYKQHAREFLGGKNYLRNKVIINFNLWSTDKSYRQTVAEQLNIPFSDQGFKEIKKVAGGSSFDGVRYSGNAHRMKLLERWKSYADDPTFWHFFDDEMLTLTEKIFGRIPPLTYFFEQTTELAEV